MTDQFPPKEVMERIYKEIANRHRQMSKLPTEKKIRCLANMQKMVKSGRKVPYSVRGIKTFRISIHTPSLTSQKSSSLSERD